MTASELLAEVLKYKNYIAKGGVTVTGGEPLLQAPFLEEFFRLCKLEDIHTALDTSGYILNQEVKEMLEYVDLVLLDIKALDPVLHKTLTGVKRDNSIKFLDYLEDKHIGTWIRHVVVPNLTDKDEELEKLAQYLKNYSVIKKVELLPYHMMGVHKYEQLGIHYKLKGVEPLSKERLKQVKDLFRKYNLFVD